MKIIKFIYFFILLFTLENSISLENIEYEKEASKPHQIINIKNYHEREKSDNESFKCFDKLPEEIMISIANLLYGNNFYNFLVSSKNLFSKLIKYKPLFMPENDQEIIKSIEGCHFDNLALLASKWSRIKRNSNINKLRSLFCLYSDYTYTIPMDFSLYDIKMYKFTMYIKFNLLVFSLGRKDDYNDLKSIKESSVKGYYQYPPNTECPAATTLQLIQTCILNNGILNTIKKRKAPQTRDILERLLKIEDYYSFVTDFFSKISLEQGFK